MAIGRPCCQGDCFMPVFPGTMRVYLHHIRMNCDKIAVDGMDPLSVWAAHGVVAGGVGGRVVVVGCRAYLLLYVVLLRIDYCGLGPFSSTPSDLMIFISLFKVLRCIIH